MKTGSIVVTAVVFLVAACGAPSSTGAGGGAGGGAAGGGSGTGGGTAAVTCQVVAATPARAANPGAIIATGSITCSGLATVSIKACLNFRSSTTSSWNEGVCLSSTKSDVSTLESKPSVGCLNSNNDYRLRVSGSVNGETLSEVESAVAAKPSCQ